MEVSLEERELCPKTGRRTGSSRLQKTAANCSMLQCTKIEIWLTVEHEVDRKQDAQGLHRWRGRNHRPGNSRAAPEDARHRAGEHCHGAAQGPCGQARADG